MEHTKGPWRHIAFGKSISIDAPDYIGLAFLNPLGARTEGIPDRRDIANAHLIAAAPDMLEALEMASSEFADMADAAGDDEHFNQGGSTYEVIQKLRAAIAKARARGAGESGTGGKKT